MRQSLTQSTKRLSDSLAPQVAVLPDLTNRLNGLTEMTRDGRKEATTLKRRADTSRYQAERLVEGADRLDHTLETYRKRMDDVEQAVQGVYALESAPDAMNEEDEADEAGAIEREDSPVSEDAVPRVSAGKEISLFSWLPLYG